MPNVINQNEEKYGTAASRWAGVGPYYAMFPAKFALEIVKEHTEPGDWIFDPFAGRGTSLFAAASEGRIGFGVEINPVGWVYGKAKLQTASRSRVEARLRWLVGRAPRYRDQAAALPKFFRVCFCREVREFLVAARRLLKWRRCKTDWTTMALLMVDLHGKRESALSNQMRQTKSMSPEYAITWWKDHGMIPPTIDPLDFMLRKVAWRYAKGRLNSRQSRVYLGDSQTRIARISARLCSHKATLLFTSPPYYGVTNYFYDQWLRLWLLGGRDKPTSPRTPCRRKFENKTQYSEMLQSVFLKSSSLLERNATVVIRTDSRKFTYDSTLAALKKAFPRKRLREERHSRPQFTQTELFDANTTRESEVDLILW
jgi:hypothetical protein